MTTGETNKNHVLKYDLTRLHDIMNTFMMTDIWKTMENTVEDSPWHREANVAVHTLMTIEAARKTFPKVEDSDGNVSTEAPAMMKRHEVLVTLALLFHDAGKPIAETTKESEERGVYRSYAGHEQQSARCFENYVVNNWDQFAGFITPYDVYVITWMIEHHLPYGLKQKDKVEAFDKTMNTIFLPNGPEVFFSMLMGDTGGRISDNYDVNYAKMMDWIQERSVACAEKYQQHMHEYKDAAAHFDVGHPVMVMLIGPSGAGKSTTAAEMLNHGDYVVYSLDTLRLKFAEGKVPYVKGVGPVAEKAKYRLAYHYYMENEAEFNNYAYTWMVQAFRSGKSVLVDNTNVGAKRRKQYLALARQNHMTTLALYVPSSLDVILARQASREDKSVPSESVVQQYYSVAVPSVGGEFDTVAVAKHNFVK